MLLSDTTRSKTKICPGYLRPGVTFEQLDSVAVALDDLAAARLVNAARDQLFRDIERRETKAA